MRGGGFEFRNAVQYVGSYKIAEAAALKITAEDGVAFLHVLGQQRVGMEAVEKDVFLIGLANARITFERDDAGTACYGTGASSSFTGVLAWDYWSSSTLESNPLWAYTGILGGMPSKLKSNALPVWPVRGKP